MSRFVNVLVPKKISDKDYQALRIFVSSNPASWDRSVVEELESDWQSAEKEYLFLGARVGANQDYEDVPYIKLDPDNPLATEFAYIQPGPDKPITKADQIRKAFEKTLGEAAKGAGLELKATQYAGYGDEEAIQLISKSLELSKIIEAPVHVKDEGVIPLGGIPRIFRKGKAEIDYDEVSKQILYWVKSRDKMPEYFDKHMQRHKQVMKQIAPKEKVEELYASAVQEFETNRPYYKDEGFIENLISAIRADLKPVPKCACGKKFFSEATRQTFVHSEFMAKEHAGRTGHVFAPDYGHMPADIKKAPYYKEAKALTKKHSAIGKGKELRALLEKIS